MTVITRFYCTEQRQKDRVPANIQIAIAIILAKLYILKYQNLTNSLNALATAYFITNYSLSTLTKNNDIIEENNLEQHIKIG